MITINNQNKKYLRDVVTFAKRMGLYGTNKNDDLKRNLQYLNNYAGKNQTRCELYPDRPLGFGFTIFKKLTDGDFKYWFNGGLLYHGPHDGFGSGSGPVFAVTVNPTNGWSIHT